MAKRGTKPFTTGNRKPRGRPPKQKQSYAEGNLNRIPVAGTTPATASHSLTSSAVGFGEHSSTTDLTYSPHGVTGTQQARSSTPASYLLPKSPVEPTASGEQQAFEQAGLSLWEAHKWKLKPSRPQYLSDHGVLLLENRERTHGSKDFLPPRAKRTMTWPADDVADRTHCLWIEWSLPGSDDISFTRHVLNFVTSLDTAKSDDEEENSGKEDMTTPSQGISNNQPRSRHIDTECIDTKECVNSRKLVLKMASKRPRGKTTESSTPKKRVRFSTNPRLVKLEPDDPLQTANKHNDRMPLPLVNREAYFLDDHLRGIKDHFKNVLLLVIELQGFPDEVLPDAGRAFHTWLINVETDLRYRKIDVPAIAVKFVGIPTVVGTGDGLERALLKRK